MRILLIHSPHDRFFFPIFPLASAQLAACLEGHEVRGYDPDSDANYPLSLESTLRAFQPELIGVSFRNLDSTQSFMPVSFVPNLRTLLQRIKKVTPGAIVALGGTGFSLFPERLMELLPQVDVGFHLDGDLTFPEFAENPSGVASMKGVFHRQGEKVLFNGKAERPVLDSLPFPDLDVFPIENYAPFGSLTVGVEGKRGCDMQCTHCVYPFFSGKRFTTRSAEKIVEQLDRLVKRGVDRFFWTDSVFNLPMAPAVEICEALVKAKLPIQWGAAFSENGFDAKRAALYREAGCRCYFFSPDGISEKAIKSYGRPITREDQKRAYSLASKQKDAQVWVGFLLGSPGEKWADLVEFAGLLLFLVFRLRIFTLILSYTRIYPQAEIARQAKELGAIDDSTDLFEPVYLMQPPASWLRFILHPMYRMAGALRKMIVALKKK